MTNFGILMEINGIEDPFAWSRKVVKELQFNGTGLYYSPTRNHPLHQRVMVYQLSKSII
jgi:hypothetical protein